MLLQTRADHAELAGHVGGAGADLLLAGDHVELEPAVAAVHNALGAQHGAISAGIQRGQGVFQLLAAVLVGGLMAPAGEHLVGVVVVVVMVPAAARAVVVVMMVLLPVVVVVAALVFLLIMVVMMVVLVLLVLIVVVMVSAAAIAFIFIVFVMMMFVLMHFFI